jgi:hypothetical protein
MPKTSSDDDNDDQEEGACTVVASPKDEQGSTTTSKKGSRLMRGIVRTISRTKSRSAPNSPGLGGSSSSTAAPTNTDTGTGMRQSSLLGSRRRGTSTSKSPTPRAVTATDKCSTTTSNTDSLLLEFHLALHHRSKLSPKLSPKVSPNNTAASARGILSSRKITTTTRSANNSPSRSYLRGRGRCRRKDQPETKERQDEIKATLKSMLGADNDEDTDDDEEEEEEEEGGDQQDNDKRRNNNTNDFTLGIPWLDHSVTTCNHNTSSVPFDAPTTTTTTTTPGGVPNTPKRPETTIAFYGNDSSLNFSMLDLSILVNNSGDDDDKKEPCSVSNNIQKNNDNHNNNFHSRKKSSSNHNNNKNNNNHKTSDNHNTRLHNHNNSVPHNKNTNQNDNNNDNSDDNDSNHNNDDRILPRRRPRAQSYDDPMGENKSVASTTSMFCADDMNSASWGELSHDDAILYGDEDGESNETIVHADDNNRNVKKTVSKGTKKTVKTKSSSLPIKTTIKPPKNKKKSKNLSERGDKADNKKPKEDGENDKHNHNNKDPSTSSKREGITRSPRREGEEDYTTGGAVVAAV